MDKEKIYKGFIKNILERRIEKLYSAFPKGYPYLKGNNKTHYYALINIVALAREEYGEEFANYLVEHFMDLDFIIRLAGEKGIICLAGRGFEGPEWTLRVSLANLYEDDYLLISQGIMDILKDYYQYYEINH